MMSIFDGMAGVLSDMLGSPVTYMPRGGGSRQIGSIFRRHPTEDVDRDGHAVLVMAPTWRVRSDLAPEVQRGDRIAPGDGRIYEILNAQPSGSPAVDAHLVCELYEVE
ncbi:hypothetical protein EOW66_02140 [Sinirhodobacter huangdaonensis]|uniref:Head-tail adaptor protein n=2 Tax=Paenirhodobacter huangdaonensis TaxID=2501515 RepID=A0A443M0L8_9RHOB|nr:hypothetical protein EOW66_02140 [Sinirhodobacter huangdaonensis]